MKRIVTLTALAVLSVGAFAQSSIDSQKLEVEFVKGANIEREINDANIYLSELNATTELSKEYEIDDNGKVHMELDDADASVVKELVTRFFADDPSVRSSSFVTADDSQDKGEDVKEVNETKEIVDAASRDKGEITLDSPAPKGGIYVELETSNNVARVPRYVEIPEGKQTAEFPIYTSAKVSKDTYVKIMAGFRYRISTTGITVRHN